MTHTAINPVLHGKALIRKLSGHSVVRGGVAVMAGSMVANILAYLYHVVVGRILGPAAYGELAALLSLFTLLSVPSSVVQTILTKFFSVLRVGNKPGEVKTLFVFSIQIIVVVALIGLCLVWISVGTVASFLHISSRANFYWLYFSFALYFIGIVPQSMLQSHKFFVSQSILTMIGMSVRLAFAIAAAPFGVTATLASNIIANITTLFGYAVPLKFLFRQKQTRLSIPSKRTFGYSVPTLLTTMAVAALYNQDVLLVKHFFPSTEAGIYSSLSVLGKVIFYASSAITYVLFPVIAERKELKQGHARLAKATLLSVGALSASMTVVYFLFPALVVRLLYGPSYDTAIPYVGIFGVFISFFSLDNILISICLAAEKILVWFIAGTAALSQLVVLWFFHTSIQMVIVANIAVSSMLFVALLIYYIHARAET